MQARMPSKGSGSFQIKMSRLSAGKVLFPGVDIKGRHRVVCGEYPSIVLANG